MSNQPNINPETTQVPIKGDCGHVFPVALARLRDGAEFKCPQCGQADRFDEAGMQAAAKDIENFKSKRPGDWLGSMIGDYIAKSRPSE